MASLILLISGFIATLQAIICRCSILAALGLLCMASPMILLFSENLSKSANALINGVFALLLVFLFFRASRFEALYLGKIVHYTFVKIEAAIAVCLHTAALVYIQSVKRKQAQMGDDPSANSQKRDEIII